MLVGGETTAQRRHGGVRSREWEILKKINRLCGRIAC